MKPILTPSIIYTGVDDQSEHMFEQQYPLPHGMSYNSYVILDDHIAIMDSVEEGRGDQWIRQIEEATDGRKPAYLVVHHMEPDHSASILKALDRWPGLTIVASAQAIGMLDRFFPGHDFAGCTRAVKEGDTLSLGSHTLTFYAAPMVHWPEVMVSVESSEKVLFSADAFGKFGALQYDDEWTNEARRYYTNIVGKYGPQVSRLLDKLEAPDIDMIAPLHGPVLKDNLSEYVALYRKWSSYTPETRGVLVAYASIYGGTAKAAMRIAEMLRGADAGEVTVMDLCACDQSEAVAQAFRLSGMVVASPTYDAGIYPAMHDFLYHLSIKGLRNRRAGIVENGSWAPVAGKLMRDMLAKMPGMEIVEPMVTVRSRLSEADMDPLRALAAAMASQP